MTGSAARGRWTRRNWRSCHCRGRAGLRCHGCAVCCASRWHSWLGSCRRPSRARGRNAGALCHTRWNDSRYGGIAGDSRNRRRCWRSRSGRLRCRQRRCGSRCASCGSGLRGLHLGFLLRFGSCFCGGEPLEMLPHKFGVVQVERARVRLLVLDADLRQVIDQHLGLYLEFSGQFIDADLVWI
jgi:hypothetical protein